MLTSRTAASGPVRPTGWSRNALLGALTLILLSARAEPAEPEFELRDGDRVVLLGGTLIERAQRFGYWEAAMTAAYPDRHVTFRNLGWSGDTVWAESRGLFDPPQQGYARMIELVDELHPSVVVLGYGNAEAFAGEAGVESFIAQYRRLLEDLHAPQRRFVLLSPLPMESLGPPLPDPTAYNESVSLYTEVIERLAADHGAHFVRLAMPPHEEGAGRDLPGPTDNGMHLNAYGYWRTAWQLRRGLCGDANGPTLEGVPPQSDPSQGVSEQAAALEALRSAIIRKNQLFFHRWRPQNFTYLFGFRKHEQGQNAAEVAEFDPLVAAAEDEIAALRRRLSPVQDQ